MQPRRTFGEREATRTFVGVAVLALFVMGGSLLNFFGTARPVGNTQAAAAALAGGTEASGSVTIEDVRPGSGREVRQGSKVTVEYRVAAPDGTSFDSSLERGTPLTFTVGDASVAKGLSRGMLGMQENGQRVIVVPPSLAYGDSGNGSIPPNATLVFTVELLKIE